VGVGVCHRERSEARLLGERARERRLVTRAERWSDAVDRILACCLSETIAREGIDLGRAEEFAAGPSAWAITLVKASKHSDELN